MASQRKMLLQKAVRLSLNICLEELEKLIQMQINRETRIWTRNWLLKRDRLGASSNLISELSLEDPKEYMMLLRMSENSFEQLLNKIKGKIQRSDTVMREAVPAKVKLEAVLTFLTTGHSLRSIQHFYRISRTTLSNMIPEVCDAIYEALQEYIKVPDNHEKWMKIERGFRSKWNHANCCGALDGKHVVLKAPKHAGSNFFNYKGTNSIVLLAIVDDDYSFSCIDVGCNGRISDGGVFRNSSIYDKLESGMLPPGTFLDGDDAFPLKKYLMKPFKGNNLTLQQKIYNYRLSRARRIVENAFGILVSKFRIFEKPIPYDPDKAVKIIKDCCVLHNWLRRTETNYMQSGCTDTEDTINGRIIDGNWRSTQTNGLLDYFARVSAHPSHSAVTLRESYMEYFAGPGAVSWQNRMVNQ